DEQQWVKGVHADVTRHSVNGHVTGYAIGKTAVRARLYNKSVEMRKAKQEWYPQLLAARNGERFDPTLDLWRLEFQLRREGGKGSRLHAKPEISDPDDVIDAELAVEDLPASIACAKRCTGRGTSGGISPSAGCAWWCQPTTLTAGGGRSTPPGRHCAEPSLSWRRAAHLTCPTRRRHSASWCALRATAAIGACWIELRSGCSPPSRRWIPTLGRRW